MSCYRCGRYGHWASECYAKVGIDGDYLDRASSPHKVNTVLYTFDSKVTNCFRCGRDSHWANDCYATVHKNGSIISPVMVATLRPKVDSCVRCGRNEHNTASCKASTYANGLPLPLGQVIIASLDSECQFCHKIIAANNLQMHVIRCER